MGLGKKQKTISLTDETWAMVKKKTDNTESWNLSAWIRAQIRMMDEGIDLVLIEEAKNSIRLQFKNLSAAIDEHSGPYDETKADIWHTFNEFMAQSRLGDFE